jgi:hypothetical protein
MLPFADDGDCLATEGSHVVGSTIDRMEAFVVNPGWRKNLVFVRIQPVTAR